MTQTSRSLTLPQPSELAAAEAALTPATDKQIGDALAILFAAFPASGTADEATGDLRIRAYALALEGVTADALGKVVKNFLQGNVSGHDGRFVPTPPQLAKAAHFADQVKRAHLNDLRRREKIVRDLERAEQERQPTAEERERVQRLVSNFKRPAISRAVTDEEFREQQNKIVAECEAAGLYDTAPQEAAE